MLKRIITSVVAFPLLALFVVLGGIPLKAAVFAIIAIGMYEVYGALSGKHKSVHFAGYVFAGIYLYYLDSIRDTNIMTIILLAFTLAVLTLLVIFHQKITVMDCAATLFGFYYVAVLMSTIYLVRLSNNGEYLVWLIFITAWGSDTGAYFAGKLLGKHKLTPVLSPNKTVEGAVGGVLLAAVLSVVYGLSITRFAGGDEPMRILIFATVGILGGIFSIFGDLTASAIKRHTKIKDFGKVLPGHGGIIDRFDSVLFTAPAVHLVILLMVR